MMHFVFAAGGTGGHIIPALAIARELKAAGVEVAFFGTGKQIESRLITDFPLEALPSSAFRGKGIKGVAALLTVLPRAVARAASLYKVRRPDGVVGFGGYPCVAPLLAARLSGIPCFLHEQNRQAGLANRFLQHFVRQIFAVTDSRGFSKRKQVRFLPLPVRAEYRSLRPWSAPRGQTRILVLGGSQGAKSLNDAILALAPFFQKAGIEVVHQAGDADCARVAEEYRRNGFESTRVFGFSNSIADELDAAHLVIARAGAMTVAEISAAGRPAIFVPLAIAGGHQARNAAHLAEAGAALIVMQTPRLAEELEAALRNFSEAPARLEEMARRAASKEADSAAVIARELIALASR